MPIIKTLAKANKQEKTKFKIPRSVQEAIPIQRVWEDGIFQLGNRFSKSYSFTDINYQIASTVERCVRNVSWTIQSSSTLWIPGLRRRSPSATGR